MTGYRRIDRHSQRPKTSVRSRLTIPFRGLAQSQGECSGASKAPQHPLSSPDLVGGPTLPIETSKNSARALIFAAAVTEQRIAFSAAGSRRATERLSRLKDAIRSELQLMEGLLMTLAAGPVTEPAFVRHRATRR